MYKHVRPYKEYYEFPNGYHEMQHDAEKDELLEKSLEFIRKLPELKNFGVASIYPIQKPKPKNKLSTKLLIILIGVLIFIIRKIRQRMLKN